MAVIRKSQPEDNAVAGLEQAMELGATAAVEGLAKYRHTILFAITALLIIAIAATVAATKVNSVIASVAEKQLINLVEENFTKDARHIQSMLTGGQGMAGMDQVISTGRASNNSMAMTPDDIGSGEPAPLTLELLIGPTGLPMRYLSLVEGMEMVGSTLFSPEGDVMWSTETHGPDQPSRSNLQLNKAEDGTISSLLVKEWEIVDRDRTVYTI